MTIPGDAHLHGRTTNIRERLRELYSRHSVQTPRVDSIRRGTLNKGIKGRNLLSVPCLLSCKIAPPCPVIVFGRNCSLSLSALWKMQREGEGEEGRRSPCEVTVQQTAARVHIDTARPARFGRAKRKETASILELCRFRKYS